MEKHDKMQEEEVGMRKTSQVECDLSHNLKSCLSTSVVFSLREKLQAKRRFTLFAMYTYCCRVSPDNLCFIHNSHSNKLSLALLNEKRR